MGEYTRNFKVLGMGDVALVGGKNASLGEMLQALEGEGIRVPGGFAVLASGYRLLVEESNLADEITGQIEAYHAGRQRLDVTGRRIRYVLRNAPLPQALEQEIREAYRQMCEEYGDDELSVAVRSSATAEDLPHASFAGQQETYLNVQGIGDLLEACSRCYASLFTDRAIAYRDENGFDHMEVALSIGVQKMLRADLGGAGVMFSIDTESGFEKVVLINAAWGVGENVVKGTVDPDEYYVFKPALADPGLKPIIHRSLGSKQVKMVFSEREHRAMTKNVETTLEERARYMLEDDDVLQLARWAVAIETHYGRPMDIEWVKDGSDGLLYVVQARPETVQSRRDGASALKTYTLRERGEVIVTGRSVGQGIVAAKACRLESAAQINDFEPGCILVAPTTDPDWVPIMKQAAGIITDHGGRTSHAAIVSRELGIPAIVGAGTATSDIQDRDEITLSCAEGETGFVYRGRLDYDTEDISYANAPETKTQVMTIMAEPRGAFRWHRLPVDGVGLVRIEFMINNAIRVHPMALVRYDDLTDEQVKAEIAEITTGYEDKSQFFVDKLAEGVASVAAAFHPNPVIVRMSDFKTNEYADLVGGRGFEPREHNPMLGFRGASRYYSDQYREGFALECRAMVKARNEIGLTNIKLMIPFCRTIEEADRVLEVMAGHGLKRGQDGLEIYVMAEIPSNIVLADQFAQRFDGFSIGSNDLTQLVLGVDRDSDLLSDLFDERNPAVKRMISQLIQTAHASGAKVGICGQGPSDYPELAEFLVAEGIDSISLNPDSVMETRRVIARAEREAVAR